MVNHILKININKIINKKIHLTLEAENIITTHNIELNCYCDNIYLRPIVYNIELLQFGIILINNKENLFKINLTFDFDLGSLNKLTRLICTRFGQSYNSIEHQLRFIFIEVDKNGEGNKIGADLQGCLSIA